MTEKNPMNPEKAGIMTGAQAALVRAGLESTTTETAPAAGQDQKETVEMKKTTSNKTAATGGKKWKMDGAKKALKAAGEKKEPRTPKVKEPRAPKAKEANLMTFAFRLTKDESAAIHRAAGPGKASQFSRAVLAAASKGDYKAIQEIVEAAKARK